MSDKIVGNFAFTVYGIFIIASILIGAMISVPYLMLFPLLICAIHVAINVGRYILKQTADKSNL